MNNSDRSENSDSDTPSHSALLGGDGRLVGLTLNAEIHDVIPADGTVVHHNVCRIEVTANLPGQGDKEEYGKITRTATTTNIPPHYLNTHLDTVIPPRHTPQAPHRPSTSHTPPVHHTSPHSHILPQLGSFTPPHSSHSLHVPSASPS
ncbi:hypothetical protein E2C01_027024 [Portunus trituberculatus]|uniref:Uncharacterized protein n=1 Tax=Portunus trituberculatus TaxID=210409 RepID=A0A5B7EKG2_PORTR|nr:hypothetical protein [Portunus trituberculatus]